MSKRRRTALLLPGPKRREEPSLRMALGPGTQFVGPTESILVTASCSTSPRAASRYCDPVRRKPA